MAALKPSWLMQSGFCTTASFIMGVSGSDSFHRRENAVRAAFSCPLLKIRLPSHVSGQVQIAVTGEPW